MPPPFSRIDPRLDLTTEEIKALLAWFNQGTNLGVADLGRLLAEAARHRFGGTTCADIMTADLVTVAPDAPLAAVAGLFRRHAIKSLPVVDGAGRLQGIVLQPDLVAALVPEPGLEGPAGTPAAIRPPRPPPRDLTAADVMGRHMAPVPDDMPVGALPNALATQGVQVVPVVRGERLVGILTRSDVTALLLRDAQDRQAA